MKRAMLAVAVLLVLALPLPALAFDPRTGRMVTVSGPIQDDLYVAGGTVDVTANVDGDVVAAGGTVTLSGPVSGGILAGAGTLRITSAVGRSIRAAAGDLSVSGRIAADAVLAGGAVAFEQPAEVGRDLVVAGGSVRMLGTVARRAFLSGGEITIGGTIQGDVEVHAERVTVLPSARIQGRLRYSADQPIEVQSGAQVGGGVERVSRPVVVRRYYRPVSFRFAGSLMGALWLLVIGFVGLAVAPRGVARVVERVERRFWMSLLTGFVLLVVVPVAAFLVALTIVGIPLSIVAFLLYLATLYPAQIFAVMWLGQWLFRQLWRTAIPSPYLVMTVGVLAFVIVGALPVLGWVIRCVAVLVGFGALWAAIWETRQRRAAATPM